MGLRAADNAFDPEGSDQWNQIIYTKIAVIGDSLSAHFPLFAPSWPTVLENRLNAAGAHLSKAKVSIKTFATGGHTFFRSNTNLNYGSKTPVEAVIEWNPDVVLVELGLNDAVDSVAGSFDGRTLAQIQSDATATYAALKAGLPGVVLIQVQLIVYDTANFTTATVKNKGIRPSFMQLKTSGILEDLASSEMLDDSPSAAAIETLDNYDTLKTHIAAISGVSTVEVNLFKTERLGTTVTDLSHPTGFGHALVAGYVMKGLRNVPAFTALVPVIATQPLGETQEDPDTLFSDCLADSGDGYVDNTPSILGGEGVDTSWGRGRHINADNWYMFYKGSCILDATSVRSSVAVESYLNVLLSDCAPNALVSYSIDAAAFTSTGISTNGKGHAFIKLPLGFLNLSIASHDFRFKVGSDAYGPHAVSVAANAVFVNNTTSVGNVGSGEDDLMTNTLPAGFFLPAAGRRVRVYAHGTFANTAAAKTLRPKFGGSTITTLNLITNLAGNWHIEYFVAHTADDAQKYQGRVTVQTGASTWITVPFQGTLTVDDDAAIVVKCTGEATNNDDIIQTYQEIDPK